MLLVIAYHYWYEDDVWLLLYEQINFFQTVTSFLFMDHRLIYQNNIFWHIVEVLYPIGVKD